jgi:hypothetical protein
MPPRRRTIKVSDREYQLIQKAREQLQRRGYERLNLNGEAKSEGTNMGDLLKGLALGAIATAGVIALLKLLEDDE